MEEETQQFNKYFSRSMNFYTFENRNSKNIGKNYGTEYVKKLQKRRTANTTKI